tara:strand:+ start:93 stop:329 length:237 start_codon:yes stop_codon:yes gene_type:complete
MIKFILVMQLCYSATQVCIPPIQAGQYFNSHKECSLVGYRTGHDIILNREDKEVNDTRAFVKFWCIEKKIENEKKVDT